MNYIIPSWPAPSHIRAFTTTKAGWGNAPYKRDEIANSENAEIKALLNLPSDPIWINQQHGVIALEALPENKNKIADASFSTTVQQICVITTADCLPLLICDKAGTQVAAIHAGWRGLAAGIIEATLDKLSIEAAQTLVWLGPAISKNKFEVGLDVFNAFITTQPDSIAAFEQTGNEKWHADLYALATMRLANRGISQIYGGEFCTYEQSNHFFSYRREGKQTGRMASLIWITSDNPNMTT